MNIGCWSGPRNLSTAMMYAFGAREDFVVRDEPFYAAYLAQTGLNHPMADEIIADGETNPEMVGADCANRGDPHKYLKLMTHHMIWGLDQPWFDEVSHTMLIRHPARVLASYAQKREHPTLSDIGFVQQCEIYDALVERGHAPVVIDSFDIRANPELALKSLCKAIGLTFDPKMLSWPKGGHPSDGIWASHWYGAVHSSTKFAAKEGPLPSLPDDLGQVCGEALPYYRRLKALALNFEGSQND